MFAQIDEPYNGYVSGMNTFVFTVFLREWQAHSYFLGNDVYGTFVFLLAIGFVVLSNVLLLNVLIAMFKWVDNKTKF